MSRANLDRLGVLHWLTYVVGNFARAIFPNRFADGVLTSPLFPDGLADGVANVSAAGFPDRLADGVLTSPLFPDGLADGVANVSAAGFPDRLADGVLTSPLFPDGLADGVLTSSLFPDRLADRVANVFAAGFPNRFADGVFTSSLFPNRLANGVANLFGTSFGNVACTGDDLVFTHAVVARLVTGMALLFPLDASDSLHHNVVAHLTARGATTITGCTTVPGVCLSGNKLQSHAGDEERTKKASHVSLPPFELWVAASAGQNREVLRR